MLSAKCLINKQYFANICKKNLKLKTKKFFFIAVSKIAEFFEGLNSSLAQSPGELCSC